MFFAPIVPGILMILLGWHTGGVYPGGLLVASGAIGEIWTAYLWSNWKRWAALIGKEP